jgi:hypothetical protein
MRRRIALVFACAALILVAQAEAAAVTELGYKTHFPPPDCPTDCQVIAQVTGFQIQIGAEHNPLRAQKPGKIVAFTLMLSKPSPTQVDFYKTTYGAKPQARVSIVRSLKKKHLYRLIAQSEVFNLQKYLGGHPTLALNKPLPVKKDDIVAITVPTWAPAFAHNLTDDMAWRASHAPADCLSTSPPPAAHQTLKSTKAYGCVYRTARLLYSATFVADPRVTNP